MRGAGALPIFFVVPDGRTLASNFPLEPAELAHLEVGLVDGREFLAREDYHPRDSHWRAGGHDAAAERLAEAVRTMRP